jgi:hypothetical protein
MVKWCIPALDWWFSAIGDGGEIKAESWYSSGKARLER